MAHYTVTKEFPNLSRAGLPVNLSVLANGGSVTVQRQVGLTWVNAAPPITTDGCFELAVDEKPVRIVVTGSAEYDV